jgi:putative PIG3 family NAD(P)H quinone oxidoreductase
MYAMLVDTTQAERPLVWTETADPAVGPGDVLVRVRATALNRADLMQRAGKYPPPPGASEIIGLEMAGEIAALGDGVAGWRVGDRVCALLPGGGYAELAAVPAGMFMPIPEAWSFAEAAALPEVYLTAFVNLYMEAALQPGETVLVHGGASGVGTAAIQLCNASGNPIFVTAGSDEKCACCTVLGADAAINYRATDWAEAAREHSGGAGVDVIMDMVGANYFAQNLGLLKTRGRLVQISTLSGVRAELDLRQIMGRRLRIIGSVLRARSVEEKIEIKERFTARFWRHVEAGSVKPVIDSVYPITEANAAHRRMAENLNAGKIVLEVG